VAELTGFGTDSGAVEDAAVDVRMGDAGHADAIGVEEDV